MRINTALILCAGFGKRLNPVTLNIPKPLLKIKDISMLERCINLIEKLRIKKILINTFYLKDQFTKFIDYKKFKKDFEILSVLRNLKIIGIFTRLAVRDKKKKYLKLIPYAWELINHRIKEKNEFDNLMLLLKNNFPKFIR